MAKNSSPLAPYRPFLLLGCLVLVAATLYWAQKVIIPLTLAVLLTFVLTPLVALLQRRGLPQRAGRPRGRVAGAAARCRSRFRTDAPGETVGGELPQYKGNIARKVAGVRGLGESGWLRNVRDHFHAVTGGVEPAETPIQEWGRGDPDGSAARGGRRARARSSAAGVVGSARLRAVVGAGR